MKTESIKEFVLAVAQLTNTGKYVNLKLFKTNDKKMIRGKLLGHRPPECNFIEFVDFEHQKPMYGFTMYLKDIETEAQMKQMVRQYLLERGWTFAGTVTQRV
tara:strand:+ start:219 stop:524 length:306 start_codon:yes stop_codon:yes gene_type:complete